MYGAILGDMIGAPYEFDQGNKSKNFDLFNKNVEFTDDSVMTIAIADGILQVGKNSFEKDIKNSIIKSMRYWGKKYPYAGYGGRFSNWLITSNPQPYNSYGNGSAMRVSSVGWFFNSIDKTRKIAKWTAEVTHNHPEGIKGAEAIASAIFLARNGENKQSIKRYIQNNFDYNLNRTCDEIRPTYHHVESCQETVPEAITAFFEGNDFEDVIRTAVSLGGDCDTLTCIAGSIAEAFYEIPTYMINECNKRIGNDFKRVINDFKKESYYGITR